MSNSDDLFSYREETNNVTPVINHVDQPRFNRFAVWGFVISFFINILGVILGHVALAQIKKTNEYGKGLAIASLVVGYLGIIIFIVLAIIGTMYGITAVEKLVDVVKEKIN